LACAALISAQGQTIPFPFAGRSNLLFIPSAASKGKVPLITMLHGCTQDPQDIAVATQFSVVGEQYGFAVLYPEHPSSANLEKCWNWFVPADQVRGSGEPQIIATMAQAVVQKYSINSSELYCAGFSAGAAMAVIMGATYPDLFLAIGVGSGLEYQAATSEAQAFVAMLQGGPSPSTQGQVAYKQMGNNARALGVMVFHGTMDFTVNYINGQQIIQQYASTLQLVLGKFGTISSTPTFTNTSQVSGGRTYTFSQYADSATGAVLMQSVWVDGMSHAWSGGSNQEPYTDPSGPNATLMLTQFFLSYTASTKVAAIQGR